MTTPRLNRIFTVSGSSTRTTRVPIRWGYDRRLQEGFPLDKGEWLVSGTNAARPADDVDLASEFAAWAALQGATISFEVHIASVEPDGSVQADVAALGDLLGIPDEGMWVRLSTPSSGDAYLLGELTFQRIFNTSIGFSTTSVSLVGTDFPMGPADYVQFSFERHDAEQSIMAEQSRTVWGELAERGSQLGIVTVGSDEPTTTGSQEEAGAVIRYEPNLAIETLLVDDLARQWTIRGSRTLEDRRYLEFDLVRQVSGA